MAKYEDLVKEYQKKRLKQEINTFIGREKRGKQLKQLSALAGDIHIHRTPRRMRAY